ncbi:hypothetical protein D9M69_634490 [compost metagenome]
MQFLGLGVGAEDRDVVAHLGFDLVVVGQRGARREAEFAQRPTLGRAVLEPLLDDESGGNGGDFTLGRVHRGILPAADVPHMNISTAPGAKPPGHPQRLPRIGRCTFIFWVSAARSWVVWPPSHAKQATGSRAATPACTPR